MHKLNVDLGNRSYPILIGEQLLANADHWALLKDRQAVVISNPTVAPLYLDALCSSARLDPDSAILIPDGEQHKTLATVETIVDQLLSRRLGRDSVLIALGGGVIGDITGFAAAIYQRGISFIQVPTTLLSQVDSSVGGKTGVNHPRGKNMIGAFHQPLQVVADTQTLTTLPPRELRAGLAEVIKYGLLGDAEFFGWLEANIDALLSVEPEAMRIAVQRSCENKARIVAEDERESGRRALLNLGHTFAHAIEAALGYGEWLHGEAVATGMCMACDLSSRLGWLSTADRDRAVALIRRAELPVGLPDGLGVTQMLELMSHDKKALSGRIRLVLMKGIGESVVTGDYDDKALRETLQYFVDGEQK